MLRVSESLNDLKVKTPKVESKITYSTNVNIIRNKDLRIKKIIIILRNIHIV